MFRLLVPTTSVALILLLAGCTSVPRAVYHQGRTVTHKVGAEIRDNDPEKWDVSVGRITMSTPLFRPVKEAKAGDKPPLDFGTKKSIPELYTALQKSGVDISNVQARLREIQLAASLQGTQTTTESIQQSALAGNLAGSLGLDAKALGSTASGTQEVEALQAILQSLLASTEVTAAMKAAGDVSGSFSDSSKTTTVDAPPPVPTELPKLIELPEQIAAKMVALLQHSSVERVINQSDLANLAGSLSVHMANMEQFYHPGVWVQDIKSLGKEWAAYQVNFNVSVEPGWYTQLNQYDAIIDATFGLKDKNRDQGTLEDSVKVISVVPFEEAQAISEIDAALDSMSSALSLSAAFQAIGIKGAYKDLRQLTTRLDGLRTTNTMVVSYPQSNSVAIRMRPPAVPNRNGRDLQPRSRVFTATMLVRQTPNAKTVELDRPGYQGIFSGELDYIENEQVALGMKSVQEIGTLTKDGDGNTLVPAVGKCAVSLDTYWEPTLVVGNWQEFPWRSGTRYAKPFLKKRLRSHYCQCDGRTMAENTCKLHSLTALVPPARTEAKVKFGITDVQGAYWEVTPGSFEGVIVVTTNEALTTATAPAIVGHTVTNKVPIGKSLALNVKLAGAPADKTRPYPIAVYVANGAKVTGITSYAMPPVGYKAPDPKTEVTITIDKPGLKVEKLPLDALTLEQLKVLVGKELRLQVGDLVQP